MKRARVEISAAEKQDAAVRLALERCVEGFNALNGKHAGFIKTIEAEDVAAVVAERAREGGLLDADLEIVDELGRDW